MRSFRLKKWVLYSALILAWPLATRAADDSVTLPQSPVWTNHVQELALLGVLDEAWTEGLNPARYHVAEIHALLTQNKDGSQLQSLLSDGIMRYGRDVSGVRAEAGQKKSAGWLMPLDGETVLNKVTSSSNPARTLAELSPQDIFYQALRAEMRRLAQAKKASQNLPPLNFGRQTFQPGKRSQSVPILRVRLGLTRTPYPADYYDDALAAAVIDFQRQNGLHADGLIDTATLRMLNGTAHDRRMQLAVNMERLRWLDRERPGRYVVVNIPSQKLWAMQDGQLALNMPVVVGSVDRQTPSFKTQITGIRFNPAWTVPPGIKMRDLLPQLQTNPAALNYTGIKFIAGQGMQAQTLDPLKIDWRHITPQALADIHMVQAPGANNALGRIRVLMPNDYDVYLHDTDAPELFGQVDRADSSGCIRMERPQAFADFVLAKNADWSADKREKILKTGRTVEIKAAAAMPLYIVYQTVGMDAQHHIIYGPDPYNEDKQLFVALGGEAGTGILLAPPQ